MDYIILTMVALAMLGLFLSRKPRQRPRDASAKVRMTSSGSRVEVTQSGRYGDAIYSENGQEAKFGWEFGGSVLAIIDIPSESHWVNEFSFPVARRREIGERVAQEVIRQKAPGAKFRWAENLIQILQN